MAIKKYFAALKRLLASSFPGGGKRRDTKYDLMMPISQKHSSVVKYVRILLFFVLDSDGSTDCVNCGAEISTCGYDLSLYKS